MINQIVPDSFVAISDFHAMEWPLEKVKDYYLNEYEKIFILGDATERGEKECFILQKKLALYIDKC